MCAAPQIRASAPPKIISQRFMRSLLLVPRLPQVLRPFGLVELVRSGKILMTRGPEAT